ncbi:unnamed protein product [marine sediment metagenome]|uniref:Uncharacterized protein n=1 Tax=marine sediment metagenome TaxID=412755 RepID=X1IDN3_9ZZZZ
MFTKWIFPDNWQVLIIAICSAVSSADQWQDRTIPSLDERTNILAYLAIA